MTRVSPPSCPDVARVLLLFAACACHSPPGEAPGGASGTPGAAARPGAAAVSSQAPATANPSGALAAPGVTAANPSGAPAAPGVTAASPARAESPAAGPGCRVMSLRGTARRAGAPLLAGERLEARPAVELGPATALQLVHTATARAWSLAGPARFIACEGGAEEVVLALGALRAQPGAGVRPGAEVWVGTPFGSLRYMDANAEVTVSAASLRVRVDAGQVWFTALDASAPERSVSGTQTFTGKRYRLSRERATERCGEDAASAETRARALLASSTRPLGERAAEHVRARQRARASCLAAVAATLAAERAEPAEPKAAASPSADVQAGYSALARFDQMWRGIPEPASPGPR